MRASRQAWLLSALLFIPEVLPSVDVYGKVGVAGLDESISARTVDRRAATECTVRLNERGSCVFTSDVDESESAPFVGIGARIKVPRACAACAVQFEFETINANVEDNLTILSVGIAMER
jgi:hypothetical protein